jgi:2-keto-4-pentenoate hydratase/2-oxohepta-3-ene-1,7-dioic acid hydratase in catechol pathway
LTPKQEISKNFGPASIASGDYVRFCRFGDNRLGLVDGCGGSGQIEVRDVTPALAVLPGCDYPYPSHDLLIAKLDQVVERAHSMSAQSRALTQGEIRLLSPVANPGKIVAAPVNYEKHLSEARTDVGIHHENRAHTLTIQKAGLFLKATSSLVGAGEGIALRHLERRNDHEVELAVVIGKTVNRISRDEALSCVAGYAIGLDITTRGTEDRSFRKSSDSYSVLGPWIVTADELGDPGHLDISISVNGEQRQKSNTGHLILGVAELIELASSFYTLYPGDVIFTGTPEGVGPIVPGDLIEASIEKIGTMKVGVRAA